MAPCALGSLVEVLVNATGAPKTEDILVTAYSPTGRSLQCPLKHGEEGHSAIFKPDEAGIWEIAITYQGRHIQGGPFTCAVFDPNGVSIHGLDGAMPMRAHSFEVDARGVGVSGELHVDIVHEKHSLVCSVEKLAENKYRVTFMPKTEGKYRVYVYFNGYDVKGSPYIMRVGTKGRSGKTRSSSSHNDAKNRHDQSSMHFTSTNSPTSKLTDFRTAKNELYAKDAQQHRTSFPPTPHDSTNAYKSNDYYSRTRDTDSYSPQLRQSSQSPQTMMFSTSQGTSSSHLNNSSSSTIRREDRASPRQFSSADPTRKSPLTDYYYNKENELTSKKHDREVTLLSPRAGSEEKYTTSSPTYVTKNFSEKYVSRQRNQTFSPIDSPVEQIRSSPVMRNSPITVTTTSRYETTAHNMNSSSPRHFSSSPSPRREVAPPTSLNFITQSTHRMSSPIETHISSPVTAMSMQTHRAMSPSVPIKVRRFLNLLFF